MAAKIEQSENFPFLIFMKKYQELLTFNFKALNIIIRYL